MAAASQGSVAAGVGSDADPRSGDDKREGEDEEEADAASAGCAGPAAAGVRPAKRSSCCPLRKRSCIQRKR